MTLGSNLLKLVKNLALTTLAGLIIPINFHVDAEEASAEPLDYLTYIKVAGVDGPLDKIIETKNWAALAKVIDSLATKSEISEPSEIVAAILKKLAGEGRVPFQVFHKIWIREVQRGSPIVGSARTAVHLAVSARDLRDILNSEQFNLELGTSSGPDHDSNVRVLAEWLVSMKTWGGINEFVNSTNLPTLHELASEFRKLKFSHDLRDLLPSPISEPDLLTAWINRGRWTELTAAVKDSAPNKESTILTTIAADPRVPFQVFDKIWYSLTQDERNLHFKKVHYAVTSRSIDSILNSPSFDLESGRLGAISPDVNVKSFVNWLSSMHHWGFNDAGKVWTDQDPLSKLVPAIKASISQSGDYSALNLIGRSGNILGFTQKNLCTLYDSCLSQGSAAATSDPTKAEVESNAEIGEIKRLIE